MATEEPRSKRKRIEKLKIAPGSTESDARITITPVYRPIAKPIDALRDIKKLEALRIETGLDIGGHKLKDMTRIELPPEVRVNMISKQTDYAAGSRAARRALATIPGVDVPIEDSGLTKKRARFVDGVKLSDIHNAVRKSADGDDRELSRIIAEFSAANLRDAIKLWDQAATRLDEQGVYHRDLGPHNLILTKDKDGKARLAIIDFGITHLADKGTEDPRSPTVLRTKQLMRDSMESTARYYSAIEKDLIARGKIRRTEAER